MRWSWDYLWPGFTPEAKVMVAEEIARVKKDKWQAVYIMPRVMFNWNEFLDRLSKVTGEGGVELGQIVGFLDRSLGEEGVKMALSIPGVTLRDNENTKASIFLENKNGDKIILPLTE